jgi:hypothetical protein
MQVLWLAIFLYSIGLAMVLHFRPALMFNENGSWKEFGYHRDSRHTIFPFWLFTVAWAFLSYVLAAAAMSLMETRGVATAAIAASAAAPVWASEREEEDEDEEEEEVVPVSRARSQNRSRTAPAKQTRPGYYVLDPEQTTGSGLRRYIYYGPERPTED